MIGLNIIFESHSGKQVMRISSYAFDGKPYVNAHAKDAGEGRHFALKCVCGANAWLDNGRTYNEYECDACGEFVRAVEFKEL